MVTNSKEQVDLLIDRGVHIEDKENAIYILSNVNFYIFKGYLYEFKDSKGYYKNISFEQAYKLYMFDKKLRSILQYALDLVENSLKTKISYASAYENGPFGYLDKNLYKNEQDFKYIKLQIKNCLKQNKGLDFIEFNRKKYNNEFPIWVSINAFNLGLVYNYYSNINNKVQETVALEYNTGVIQLTSWIKCIQNIRNKVAHYMRIYNVTLVSLPERCPNNHKNNFPNTGKLFDVLQIMQFMTNDVVEWNEYILPKIYSLLKDSKEFIKIELLGFPKNWKQILTKNKVNSTKN